jgi:hypothetical protein
MGERARSRPTAHPDRPRRTVRPGRPTPPDKPPKRRRVLIADARRNGSYLRTTWHAESGMFVVSTWNGEVCLGAIRVPAADAAELMSLLMDGLVDMIGTTPQVDVPPVRAPSGWDVFRNQLRAWMRTGATKAAAVKHLRITTEPPRRDRSRRSA